ncbi:MAG TPA: HAD-IIIC family phosphatase [Caulobacteraceae bacterium]|nr:HAD-IIIC family phosphatase [Caulobacteraceae bacterium]
MLTSLDWLPKPTEDFRSRVKALRSAVLAREAGSLLEPTVALATAALDESQLAVLARLAADLAGASAGARQGFSSVRLGLVGDGTLSLVAPAICGSGLRHGLLIEVVEGEYNSAVGESSDPDSRLRRAGLEMLLIAPDARILGLDRAALSPEEAGQKVASAFARLEIIARNMRPAVSGSVFVQTVPPQFEPLFGSFDRVEAGSPFAMVEALNGRIAAWAGSGEVVLIDTARLAASVGLERWDEPRHWHASKLPFAPDLIPAHADVIARAIASARGRAKKCLVLDLDNTLWGGVIGDDGLAGIDLGQGSASGEAFLAVQRLALELRGRGVVLAVCSKNDDAVARSPFREHPDMLLKEEHIAVFQANWTDKASNLRAIAKALNIGVDALVLLDDNPAERLQVRSELPLVGVPELPEDPALYPRILAAAGYFEAVGVSREDRDRAAYYQANAERAAALAASSDMLGYLRSLDMTCKIGRIDALSRARSAQLINKSNQFNLTTRRYTEAEVATIEADPHRHAIQVRLIDRFGDNGIISIVIADKRRDEWEIDTWLMSCRVLGRRVEEAILNHLADAAREAGALALVGRYLPTAKNAMVADHYGKLGFTLLETRADGASVWRLELEHYAPAELPMTVADTARTPQPVEA